MSQQKNQDIRGGAPPDRPRQDSTDLPASNARDADARREHREAPGSGHRPQGRRLQTDQGVSPHGPLLSSLTFDKPALQSLEFLMDHGRDHSERQQKAGRPRANNIPPDAPSTDMEAEFLVAGRGGGVPRQGVVGAHEERPGYSVTGQSPEEGEEPLGRGADVAPTERAEQRERERHQLEKQMGRATAGQEGRIHDQRTPEITQEQLAQAAQEADRRVGAAGKKGTGN